MTPGIELDTLWPRLFAAGVRWREGMLSQRRGPLLIKAARILTVGDGLGTPNGVPVQWYDVDNDTLHSNDAGWDHPELRIPDLDDPPTCGGLLAELRRLTDSPAAQVTPVVGWPVGTQVISGWYACQNDYATDRRFPRALTEGEALCVALAVACGVSS